MSAPLDQLLGNRNRLPYILGVYVATNAIPDAFAIVDGPDCALRNAEWVHGKHDLRSTLLDVNGRHRVVATLTNAERVIREDGQQVVRRLRSVAGNPAAGLALVVASPHVALIGTQYDLLLRQLQPELPIQLVEIPNRSFDGDWLDGYAQTLDAIAASIDVAGPCPTADQVAIFGYLMDRTEEDHQANVRELERLLNGIGLKVASVWLSGRPLSHLRRARDAATILAFPLGREAAQTYARRTGARVVEVGVPFGAGRTQTFLRSVAAATDRSALAEELIDRELTRLVPRLEWVVDRVFLGKTLAFCATPDLFGGMLQLADEIGMRLLALCSHASERHTGEDLTCQEFAVPPLYFPLSPGGGLPHMQRLREAGVQLAIGNTMFCDQLAPVAPVVELGFPSLVEHCFAPRPSLGFEGWIALIDRMAGALARAGRWPG